MQVSIEKSKNGGGSDLVIRIPLEDPPKPSSTGKTLVVASSHGNVKTDVKVKGSEVFVGLNAYIKPGG